MPSINLSDISSRTLLGKLLRLPLRLVPPDTKVPILQGRLRGKWWIAGASLASFWLGSFELEKQALMVTMVPPGKVAFDLGAHVGFYTLLFSELVGPEGRVVAFEPVPRNLAYLRRHIQLNRLANVTVVEAAVAESGGRALFLDSGDSASGRLAADGQLEVSLVSLDGLVGTEEIPGPDFIKIDVEGAEYRVLLGAKSILAKFRPTLFLATHGRDCHRRCCAFLIDMGYELMPLSGSLEDTDEVLAIAHTRLC